MSEVRARRGHGLIAVVLLPLVVALGGCSSAARTTAPPAPSASEAAAPPTTPAPTSPTPPSTRRPPTTRRRTAPSTTRAPLPGPAAVLARLPTGTLDHAPPYSRTVDFGRAWLDADHNGCDTRNDILRRDLTGILVRTGTNGCVVVGGLLHDRYTGTTIAFSKAHATEVQIDHVVPLHDAWELGAYRWTQAEREAYANDPLVLLAVSGPENEAKGDKLADEWTPPNRAEWCDYATRTIAIHARYALPVTAGERQALGSLLTTCP